MTELPGFFKRPHWMVEVMCDLDPEPLPTRPRSPKLKGQPSHRVAKLVEGQGRLGDILIQADALVEQHRHAHNPDHHPYRRVVWFTRCKPCQRDVYGYEQEGLSLAIEEHIWTKAHVDGIRQDRLVDAVVAALTQT